MARSMVRFPVCVACVPAGAATLPKITTGSAMPPWVGKVASTRATIPGGNQRFEMADMIRS